ncbi:MAG: TatD family hydrolase [Rickettsiales bacterium]|nr:TatD family hydrolase [Rickettsiales bacterium]
MLLVDSHCHLDFPDFTNDLGDVITRARENGISVMQSICTKMPAFERIHTLVAGHENMYCSVGVHPHEVEKHPMVSVEELVEKSQSPKVIGLGETGLDYYYEHSPRALQQESFRRHIEAARITGLPVIIHSRDADDDMIRILREEKNKGDFPALIHCFSSTAMLAQACVGMGIPLSISGIITFKKSDDLRTIVRDVPLEMLLVETDSPYLAPMPHRGKRNEPAFTRHTAEALAALKGVTLEECARITTDNFFRLFSKAHYPAGMIYD